MPVVSAAEATAMAFDLWQNHPTSSGPAIIEAAEGGWRSWGVMKRPPEFYVKEASTSAGVHVLIASEAPPTNGMSCGVPC